MAIWTSRYSNKELTNGNFYPVGISIGQPKFRLGYELREQCYSLAPKGYMLNMDIEKFKQAYYGKLEGIGTEQIISMVNKLRVRARSEGKELVLLCFEDVRLKSEWCHRTIFAQWWAEKVGEIIKELPDSTPPNGKVKRDKKKPVNTSAKEDSGYEQMSIFSMAGI